MILRIYPNKVRVRIIVFHGVIVLVAGEADKIGVGRGIGNFLGVIGVFVGVNAEDGGAVIHDHIIGSIYAIAGGIERMVTADDGNAAPLIPLIGNVAVCGFDAIAYGCDQHSLAALELHTVVAFQRVIQAGYRKCQIFHL